MFKDFTNLDDKLKALSSQDRRNKISTILSQADTISSIANSLASEYGRAYSQIQWMKYDSDGNPSDVTPSANSSVADSIVESKKERVKTALQIADDNKIVSSTTDVPGLIQFNVLGLFITWEDVTSTTQSNHSIIAGAPFSLDMGAARYFTLKNLMLPNHMQILQNYTQRFSVVGFCTDSNGKTCLVIALRSQDSGNPIKTVILSRRSGSTMDIRIFYLDSDSTWHQITQLGYATVATNSSSLLGLLYDTVNQDPATYPQMGIYWANGAPDPQSFYFNQQSSVYAGQVAVEGETLEILAPGITDVANAILNL